MSKKSLKIIGMHEKISIPKQAIDNLPTKTDTGAYNSAIDCHYAEEIEKEAVIELYESQQYKLIPKNLNFACSEKFHFLNLIIKS